MSNDLTPRKDESAAQEDVCKSCNKPIERGQPTVAALRYPFGKSTATDIYHSACIPFHFAPPITGRAPADNVNTINIDWSKPIGLTINPAPNAAAPQLPGGDCFETNVTGRAPAARSASHQRILAMSNDLAPDESAAHVAGQEEGHTCNRDGCGGVIAVDETDRNCSCHISPPCGSCTVPREYCPECDWRARDDEVPFNDHLVRPANPDGAWASWRPRPLDPTKIDWRTRRHSNASMIKEGVYPQSGNEAADRAAVLAKVIGTFGGRFNHFGHGRFEYVAYTD